MKTVLKCAAVASVFMLTAGSAALAQNNSTSGNPGSSSQSTYGQGTQGYNTGPQGYQGTYNSNQGTYGASQGTYRTNPGTYGNNQGTYGTNPGTYGNNQGTYGTNQGSWNTGTQGSSSPYTGQTYSSAGYGTGNINTYQEAEQELSKYGYSNVQGLRAMQGWSADAMKNGQKVHVLLGDNGLVATFPGR